MADRDEIDRKGDDHSVVPPDAVSANAAAPTEAKGQLPDIDSPSISPAISEAVPVEEQAIEPEAEPEVEAANRATLHALVPLPKSKFDDAPPFEPLDIEDKPRRFAVKPRHWRTMRLAASVAIGAIAGALVGVYATGGLADKPQISASVQEESKAMQQSVAKLAKEVTTLKANLDAANKRAQTQTASLEKKFNDQLNDRLKKEASDITGSISAPQTIAAAPAQSAQVLAEVPTPRPAPRVAMAQTQVALSRPSQVPSARPPIVRDWSVRGAYNGYVYVQGQRGDVYQIVPGAPLPGLGPVQSVRRMDGRWVVTTPKGIIVSMRDRHYFE
ncbi:MAG: hypothetical protein WC670_08365 [Pseudolabrys sp.]|jgi:hypothetical protein